MKHTLLTLVLIALSIFTFAQNKKDTSEIKIDSIQNEKTYLKVEEMPYFPGGEKALKKYISKNLSYPKQEKESKVSGKVYVSFIIEKDGSITDIKVLRGLKYYFDKEAIRLVRNMPNWIPGIQSGEKAKVQYVLPIEFSND